MIERAVLVVLPVVISCLIVLGFISYQCYIQEKIFQESSEHLLTTYEQVDKTFSLFSQRNWNVLADLDEKFFEDADKDDFSSSLSYWQEFFKRKNSWMYSDFFLFNKNCDYFTADGRQGRDASDPNLYDEVFHEKKRVITSYISTSGNRKIVFSIPLSSSVTIDGVTYDGLAISYENEVVEGLTTSNVFNGVSDCYVIKKNGDVVMSLSPKSEFPDFIGNMFDYLSSNVSFERGSADDMRSGVESGQAGSAYCVYGENKEIVVWVNSATQDWSIVGVVRDEAVNSGMHDIQIATIAVLAGLFLCAGVLVFGGFVLASRRRLRDKELERLAIAHQKKLSDELFSGLAKMVDRFAICDLESDTYEYHEHEYDYLLYPPRGCYTAFVERMSKRYVVTSDPDNMKIGSQLSVDHLRESLRGDGDVVHFEYAGRDIDVFKIMSVVPVEWDDDGELKKVLLSCQDIGRRVELENISRTDGLTGLFNERGFARILHIRQESEQPFTLLYLDLDRFKPVNDTYGHDAGDLLLKEVAHRIQGCIRDEDYAFRIGGDEFAIVFPSQLSCDLIERRIEQVKHAICQPIEVDGHTVSVGASCGWAVFPHESTQASTIRKIADRRMYADKEKNHAGR